MQEALTLFSKNIPVDNAQKLIENGFVPDIKVRYQNAVEAQTFATTKDKYSRVRVGECVLKEQDFFNSGIVENGKVWTGCVLEGQEENDYALLSDFLEEDKTDEYRLSKRECQSLIDIFTNSGEQEGEYLDILRKQAE